MPFVYNPFTDNLDNTGTGGGGGGGIETINGVSPDGSGEFTLDSGDGSVTITPITNGVDLSATGSFTNEYFSAYLGAPMTGVTGDGTIVAIPFDGIISNTSGSYNPATGVYTAPTAGAYVFYHTVTFDMADASNISFMTLWNGNTYSTRAFLTGQYNPAATAVIFSASIGPINLGVGDTMAVSALVSGSPTPNVAIYGAIPSGFATTSVFSGFKLA